MSKRNNQAKQHFSYKRDEEELVELCQFIREAFPGITIEREWCIFYDRNDNYLGFGKTMEEGRITRFRTPDVMIIRNNKLVGCLELDGKVHEESGFGDTLERNELYEKLRVPLKVITKSQIKISIFDDAYKKVSELLGVQ